MKIRTGFVSNSSSSSFCIYGYKIETMTEEWIRLCSLLGIDSEINGFDIKFDTRDMLKGLDIECGQHGYYIIFGRQWKYIDDYETGLEFKDNIKKALESFLGHPVECETFEEGWYDG